MEHNNNNTSRQAQQHPHGAAPSNRSVHAASSVLTPPTGIPGAAAAQRRNAPIVIPSSANTVAHSFAQQPASLPGSHRPQGTTSGMINYSTVSGLSMHRPPAPSPAWNVPNPLGQAPSHPYAAGGPSLAQQQQKQAVQQQQQQQQLAQQQQRMVAQQQQKMASAQQMGSPQQQQQQQHLAAQRQMAARGTTQPRKKVVLSQEAKQALARAIWSAIRSPTGEVDPTLMQRALQTGLPRNAILNAARVAREREAVKRKALQQQSPQQQQRYQLHQQKIAQQTKLALHKQQQQQQLAQQQKIQQQQQLQQKQRQYERQKLQQQKLQQQERQAKAQRENALKIAERRQWKRAQNGVFMVQKGRFLAVPFSVGAMVRANDVRPVLPLKRRPVRQQAAALQRTLLAAAAAKQQAARTPQQQQLLDPDRHKRVKMEPKKYAKALDRFARKSRQAVAEGFLKQYKEFNKAISSHQADFFKFHRTRKADLNRLCKAVRDVFDKESKRKEKDAVAAEKARMAALKANDMTAYSKLLEDTKSSRLQFLLEKTEKHFAQISSLLQENRETTTTTAPTTGASSATTSYYASAHRKTENVRQPSILVGGDLKTYQLTGLQWLVSLYNNKLNGILADEMGLGKTIQAIALVAYLMELKHNLGPYLIIVPLSTLSNWENEFAKWCPAARLVCYKGTPPQRRQIYKDRVQTGHFNVLLTTYEYIIRDKKYLRKIVWQYAIVDEGHRMKNSQSKFAVTLASQYTTKFRILLTGTPLMNDLSELWSLLNFLLPSIFNSVETFDQWFSRPFAQMGGATAEEGADTLLNNEERVLIIHRLHELLRPFMLRRVKSEVLDQLPEKVEKVLRCDLSSWQKVLYKQISTKAIAESGVAPTAANRGLNNVVMQLRKVCNHPFLFSPEGYHIGDKIIRSSGKVALLDQMLPKLKAAGHRVLMFTQMTAVMTILEDYFAYRGYLSLRLDGSTPAEVREKRMYKFNAPDSPYFIFLLSTRAGGLGLNLTSADTVIIFDSDWNPMMDLQAQDRAHRIGQRSDVSVFRLITYSPVEEKILSRATEKLNVSELVVESGKFNKDSVESDNSLERKRLMEVLLTDFDTQTPAKSGFSEKSGSDEGDDDDVGSEDSDKEDLNELLSNNEADYQLYAAMDREREEKGPDLPAVYTEDADVPDWILNPNSSNGGPPSGAFVSADAGPRKRKAVAYDDGLTEKQFLRLMDKQAIEEENARKKQKTSKGGARSTAVSPSAPANAEPPKEGAGPTLLTDWTFRKLISCSKSVVALKDPSTKRRLSEIFLEKPDPSAFPDYYELIEKPIAINDILRKCRAKMYANIPEFRADWKLMFANAVKFNGEGSWVVEDAHSLEKELERVLKKNGFTDDQRPPTSKKKKKLRIKLSLKDVKIKGGES